MARMLSADKEYDFVYFSSMQAIIINATDILFSTLCRVLLKRKFDGSNVSKNI